ncbi:MULTISPECIES: hypothetical protein [unclassified Ruegeria]|uniref:hypothetical protein n=1 Tax=unclassified Ruegeria TaxID=2625375 RepID=UPI001487CABA|nr:MULTISPECIES: hypothetical protein [unclassified Ruegeria]NOD64215.1 hypothetical protein [Ruegeria sp. HKCCD6109]
MQADLKVRFGELIISKKELLSLGPQLARAVVSTSFVAQEIREFVRLVDGAIVEYETQHNVQLMQTAQRSTLLRALALKVDNFLNIWEHLLSNPNTKAADTFGILEDLHSKYSQSFSDLREHPGQEIAKHVRDRMTAHTDLVATQKSIELFQDDWSVSILYNAAPGNSFFALGEDVVFGAGLMHQHGRKGSEKQEEQCAFSQHEATERLKVWNDYVIDAASVCLSYHIELIHAFPEKCLNKRGAPWIDLAIPAKRHSTLEDFRLPVYSRNPDIE